MGIIYKITNKINNKVYIGQTIQNLKDRWYQHCGFKSSNEAELRMVIKRAIHKYGKENFDLEILERVDDDKLNEREIFWIDKYDSYNNGYNSTRGGQSGRNHLKLEKSSDEIIDLYKFGFSLREIAKEYKVDHATIKKILVKNNVILRNSRTYNYSQADRLNIISDYENGLSRKEIINKYGISKSYLSQLISGKRRI